MFRVYVLVPRFLLLGLPLSNDGIPRQTKATKLMVELKARTNQNMSCETTLCMSLMIAPSQVIVAPEQIYGYQMVLGEGTQQKREYNGLRAIKSYVFVPLVYLGRPLHPDL